MRLRSLIPATVALLLVGCASRLPEWIDDCEITPYVEQWDTVEDCKMAVLKREDNAARRRAKSFQDEANAKWCWKQYRAGYDAQREQCVSVSPRLYPRQL